MKHLNKSEISTILFALRYLQSNYSDSGIEDSEHFKDDVSALTEDEIDQLCETLNTEEFQG